MDQQFGTEEVALSFLVGGCKTTGTKSTENVIYKPPVIWVDSEWTGRFDAGLLVTATMVEANVSNV
ncbi:hypothetical protein CsSME_00052027 [Camellia sinensis var. sinensis]